MKRTSGIQYIRQQVPSVSIPPYEGEVYEDLVPDTLDIAERIDLAVNGVTGPTDPEADCEMYFWINFFHEPPVMSHSRDDWCQPKFMESLPLLRIASGSDLNSYVDEVWKDVLLRSIGPDGLFYFPLKGGTWFGLNMPDYPLFLPGGKTMPVRDESVTHFATPFACGRLISAMTLYYLHDRNPIWKEIVEKMVLRLAELAIDRGDHCFYPEGLFAPYAELSPHLDASAADGITDMGGARLIEALARYYRETGYGAALELARKLANAVRYHSGMFDEKGAFINRRGYTEEGQAAAASALPTEFAYGGHFHSHAICLLNLVEYALAARDQEMLAFTKRSYEWAREQGSRLTGYFPTVINPRAFHKGLPYSGVISPWYDEFEICELADMLAIALKLSTAGVSDYYDDAERWVRNYFAEGQLTRIDWIHTRPRYMDTRPLFPNETAERVAERALGGFGGWLSGNDWATRMGIMQCCTGNGTRALYYIWERQVEVQGEVLKVNLLLNHASPWVDVHSYSPYEGRLDLKVKKECDRILIHAPEWVVQDSPLLQVRIGSEARVPAWEGRYVDAGSARSGDVVVMTYPIDQYIIREQLGDGIYTLTVKGNTVIDIDPPGRHCPLYQRAHYRENQVRWRRIRRYVSEERPHW